MKSVFTFYTIVAVAALTFTVASTTADAQMIIGLDFSGGGTPVPSSTAAGYVVQTNWNNLSAATGSLGAGSIVDNSGATVSGLSASWGANGSVVLYSWGQNSFTGLNATGNTDLYSSSQLTFGGPGTGYQGDISLSGIPYLRYDVYAYFQGTSGNNGLLNLNGTPNGTTFTGGTSYAFTQANGVNFFTTPGGGGPADYAVFTNLSASSLTLYDQSGSSTGLVGIQIVNTAPEPSTWVLALGGLGLLCFYGLRLRRA